ncbi:hypothetical protein TSAR_014207 [Trichomalopsis sarcophagae]|uniref:ZP domain-containing protein n=1 Tax=Trichomalopsis sarcophagae TaxID=543379 RepID=A0A232FCE4_9HYME|nr:hypothetical protein TSAR_014207 [Trichomalopsis sarcophagae]
MFLAVLLWGLLRHTTADSAPSHCYINVTRDISDNQPLLLRHNSSEFQYPRVQSPSSFELNAGKAELRVACPNDLLVVDGETLGIGSGFLKCHGGSNFGVAGSQVSTPFGRIGCTKPTMLVARVKRNNCPANKCMQVGFHMNVFTFLSVIDTIAYDTENRVPIWAHVKVVACIEGRQRSIIPSLTRFL